MMTSHATAARWQAPGRCIRREKRHDQRKAEEPQKRDGKRTSHEESVSKEEIVIQKWKATMEKSFCSDYTADT